MNLTPRLDKLDKNYIINGNFDFWQRGTDITGDSAYSTDRMKTRAVDANAALSRNARVRQSTDVPANIGASYSAIVSTTTANTTRIGFAQYIEQKVAKSLVVGSSFTVSFYVKRISTENANTRLVVSIGAFTSPDTIGTNFASDDGATYSNRTQIFNDLSTTAWTRIVYTNVVTSQMVANGFMVNVRAEEGASGTSLINLSNGDLFKISGFMLHASDKEQEFSTAGRNYAEELMLCQRYYERHTGVLGMAFDNANSTTSGQVIWQYKVKKRANATNTVGSSVAANSRYYGPSGLRGISTFVTGGISNIDAGGFTVTLASAAAQYQGGTIAIIANGATDYLDADAEL